MASTPTVIGRVYGDIYTIHQPSTKAYRVLDEVRLPTGWYRAKSDVPIGVAITDATYWQKVYTPESTLPAILTEHDPDAGYARGTEIRLIDGWYRAILEIPAGSSIALTDTQFWEKVYVPSEAQVYIPPILLADKVEDVWRPWNAYKKLTEIRGNDAWYRALQDIPEGAGIQLTQEAWWQKIYTPIAGNLPTIYKTHDVANGYAKGDEVRLSDGWWYALQAVPADTALEEGAFWTKTFTPSSGIAEITAQMIMDAIKAAYPQGSDDSFLNQQGEWAQVGQGGGVISKTSIMNALLEGSPSEPSSSKFLAEDGSFHLVANDAKFLPLESIGSTLEEAEAYWVSNRADCEAMAARNQLAIEKALGKIDDQGNPIPDDDTNHVFNIELPVGYIPIEGDLIIPPRSGKFLGQGAFRRYKSTPKVGGGNVQSSILEYPTALMPIGGSDKNGVMTQCIGAHVGRFAILGKLKAFNDGGNALMVGHTPPVPDAANSVTPTHFAASMHNHFTQDRFVEPEYATVDSTAVTTQPNGDVHITIPIKGSFSDRRDLENLLADDEIDVPLVRWVRTFDANGKELERWSNIGYHEFIWMNDPAKYNDPTLPNDAARKAFKLELKNSAGVNGFYPVWAAKTLVGINNNNRMTTSDPAKDDQGNIIETERVYHLPIGENDTTTTIVIPGGFRDEVITHPSDPAQDVSATPADVVSIEVSLYKLEKFQTMKTQMMPYLGGGWSRAARCQFNIFDSIVLDGMPWNGYVGVDGAYNNHTCISARNNGLDGFFFPGGYEDFMHNSFDSCSAVNNGGWALYLSEAKQGISGLPAPELVDGDSGWPTGKVGDVPIDPSRFVWHKKLTYTASLNDFSNFDCYGNRGGALYIGADSNTINTGGSEHHFDTHNKDPLGRYDDWVDDLGVTRPGVYIDTRVGEYERGLYNGRQFGDWSPLRWFACYAFAAVSRQNDLTITGTPTDTRRCWFAKWVNHRLKPVHPTSNLYRAIASNHFVHPRQDNYGSLVDVRSKSIANLFLTQYSEHERTGDILNNGQGIIELVGTFIKKDTYGVMPFLYPISKQENSISANMDWVFTNKHPESPCPEGLFTLSADALGIVGQTNITMMYVNNVLDQMKGTVLGPGESKVDSVIVPAVAGFDPETDDISRLICDITYVVDDVDDSRTAPRLPDYIRPVIQGFERTRNGAGDVRVYVRYAWHNFSATETYTADANDEKHLLVYRLSNHTPNNVLNGL